MAKSKVIPITRKPGDAVYDAAAKLAEIRAELLCASEVLSDSAFSGGNSITDERDCCAVLVFQNGVKRLGALQAVLDDISVRLAQPKAIAELKRVGHE